MDRLEGEVTFALNRLFLMDLAWSPTFWFLVDVKHDDGWPWRELLDRDSQFLIRHDVAKWVEPHRTRDNVEYFRRCQLHMDIERPPPSWHFPDLCHFGGGISIALQRAAQLGYSPIYLIGCDLYVQRTGEEDINHFDPNYAALRGVVSWDKWNDANRRLVIAHEIARSSAAAMGCTIYNATVGGRLEVYERANIHELI